MKILFCRIEWMERYQGIVEQYRLIGKDSEAREESRKYESWNFKTDIENEFVFGYVPTKHHNGKLNSIHIERIDGISKEDEIAHSVLVVWVSKEPIKDSKSVIIGWYKNADVFRNYTYMDIDDEKWPVNVIALSKNVILLPIDKRTLEVPWAGGVNGSPYGMAQSNIWFADKAEEQTYVEKVFNYIENYNGENWVGK
ncbi:hypothetical protein [Clostridium tarantellae]|uniref:Uncharacterized protein n=1 Tax=Clostridium tarantellae TaxID=39493 RepID=A0A6I1MJM9_9CLOT|nr:hypothetical protein [Clostridium tarantellae]MPQ42913.1 hypothetical protein [Clostridium tarantellae]